MKALALNTVDIGNQPFQPRAVMARDLDRDAKLRAARAAAALTAKLAPAQTLTVKAPNSGLKLNYGLQGGPKGPTI